MLRPASRGPYRQVRALRAVPERRCAGRCEVHEATADPGEQQASSPSDLDVFGAFQRFREAVCRFHDSRREFQALYQAADPCTQRALLSGLRIAAKGNSAARLALRQLGQEFEEEFDAAPPSGCPPPADSSDPQGAAVAAAASAAERQEHPPASPEPGCPSEPGEPAAAAAVATSADERGPPQPAPAAASPSGCPPPADSSGPQGAAVAIPVSHLHLLMAWQAQLKLSSCRQQARCQQEVVPFQQQFLAAVAVVVAASTLQALVLLAAAALQLQQALHAVARATSTSNSSRGSYASVVSAGQLVVAPSPAPGVTPTSRGTAGHHRACDLVCSGAQRSYCSCQLLVLRRLPVQAGWDHALLAGWGALARSDKEQTLGALSARLWSPSPLVHGFARRVLVTLMVEAAPDRSAVARRVQANISSSYKAKPAPDAVVVVRSAAERCLRLCEQQPPSRAQEQQKQRAPRQQQQPAPSSAAAAKACPQPKPQPPPSSAGTSATSHHACDCAAVSTAGASCSSHACSFLQLPHVSVDSVCRRMSDLQCHDRQLAVAGLARTLLAPGALVQRSQLVLEQLTAPGSPYGQLTTEVLVQAFAPGLQCTPAGQALLDRAQHIQRKQLQPAAAAAAAAPQQQPDDVVATSNFAVNDSDQQQHQQEGLSKRGP